MKLNQLSSKNKKAIGIISIVISFILMIIIVPSKIKNERELKIIYVASQNIKEGTAIQEEMLKEIEVYNKNVPDDAISSLDDIENTYATRDVYKNNIITNDILTREYVEKYSYLNKSEDKVAMSVTISTPAKGLSYKLHSGDIVSIIINNGEKSYIPQELEYVRVISTTLSDEEGSSENETVTLLVDKKQAEILATAENTGGVHITLASRGDEDKANKMLEEQDKVLVDMEVDDIETE